MGDIVIHASVLFVLHRLLSGIRNGTQYNRKPAAENAPLLALLAMSLVSIILGAVVLNMPSWAFIPTWLSALKYLFIPASWVAGYFATQLHSTNKWLRDIHLWTEVEQLCLSAMMLLSGIPGVIVWVCTIYPAVFTQKTVINRFCEMNWYEDRTDDPTGATYSIPVLNLKIPRTTQKLRAILTAISIALLFTLGKFL